MIGGGLLSFRSGTSRRLILPLLLSICLSRSCHAALKCAKSAGGGTCPNDNTCCPLFDADGHQIPNASACLPPNKHIAVGAGVCCGGSLRDNVWGETVMTGCPHGYRCATNIAEYGQIHEFCQRVTADIADTADKKSVQGKLWGITNLNVGLQEKRKYFRGRALTENSEKDLLSVAGGICSNATDAVHPPSFLRYSLCTLPPEAFEIVHGFPIKDVGDLELAYYSNMGSITVIKPITNQDDDPRRKVRLVFISVHGSSRNADDYLCAAHSASRLQQRYPPDTVLVVAPRFLVPEDGPVPEFRPSRDRSGALPLRWNETHPIDHTWRYGADSISGGLSSYDALDALVEYFAFDPDELYPNLKAIVLAGHSAGGQLAQRYALLSPVPVLDGRIWQDGNTNRATRRVEFRSVAANPRSYCYLDDRRPERGGYGRPSAEKIAQCPRWNQWQWGLDEGGDVAAPYRDRAIEAIGGVGALNNRFLQRNMTHLAGTKDIIPLQGKCEDDLFQGECRLERAHLYFNSLRTLFNSTKHIFKEVDGSNHDHTFMFQSPAGLQAIFDEESLLE